MKKIFLLIITFCFVGFFSACDKEKEHPSDLFIGTVWKFKYLSSANVFEYQVIKFISQDKYIHYKEDSDGYIFQYIKSDNYIVDPQEKTIFFNADKDLHFQAKYSGNPPVYFNYYIDGKTWTFVKQ